VGVNVDNIRGFLKRKPFRSFDLRTAGGDRHKVTHPESIAFSPKGDVLVLWPSEGGLVLVDVDQITEASYPAARPK
jgi:hypothetical protein